MLFIFHWSLIRYLIDGEEDALNPKKKGTKVSPLYVLEVEAGAEAVVRMRLTNKALQGDIFGSVFDDIFEDRISEANDYYDEIIPATLDDQQTLISRQAYAGQFLLLQVEGLMHWEVKESKKNIS